MKYTVLSTATRLCPSCKERAYYNVKHDFKNADISDEMERFRECRLCGHKDIFKKRVSNKQKERSKFIQDILDSLDLEESSVRVPNHLLGMIRNAKGKQALLNLHKDVIRDINESKGLEREEYIALKEEIERLLRADRDNDRNGFMSGWKSIF